MSADQPRFWLAGALFAQKVWEAITAIRDAESMLDEPGALHPSARSLGHGRLDYAQVELVKLLANLAGPIERSREAAGDDVIPVAPLTPAPQPSRKAHRPKPIPF